MGYINTFEEFLIEKNEEKKHLKNIIILLLLMIQSCTDTDPEQTETLRSELLYLKTNSDSLSRLLLNKEIQENYWIANELDNEVYKKFEIENPIEYIKQSLRNKPEQIPLEPILGGTMHFGNIQILGKKWIIAEFDDGHIYGRGIYTYNLQKDCKVEFELLDYSIPEE